MVKLHFGITVADTGFEMKAGEASASQQEEQLQGIKGMTQPQSSTAPSAQSTPSKAHKRNGAQSTPGKKQTPSMVSSQAFAIGFVTLPFRSVIDKLARPLECRNLKSGFLFCNQ